MKGLATRVAGSIFTGVDISVYFIILVSASSAGRWALYVVGHRVSRWRTQPSSVWTCAQASAGLLIRLRLWRKTSLPSFRWPRIWMTWKSLKFEHHFLLVGLRGDIRQGWHHTGVIILPGGTLCISCTWHESKSRWSQLISWRLRSLSIWLLSLMLQNRVILAWISLGDITIILDT